MTVLHDIIDYIVQGIRRSLQLEASTSLFDANVTVLHVVTAYTEENCALTKTTPPKTTTDTKGDHIIWACFLSKLL